MPGEFLAAQITERSLAVHKIPVYKFRQTNGDPLTNVEAGGGFNLDLDSNILLLEGEITNNETETSVGTFQFTLPPNYVAGGGIQVQLKVSNIGPGTQTSCTLTIKAYKSDGNGAVGSNLGPSDRTHAAKTTWYLKDFPITATGLVAGDTLNIELTVVNIESAVANLVWTCDEVAMLLDIQG